MRLNGIIAVAAASAPLLASCSGSDYSKTPWMAHDQQCEKLGFKRGMGGDQGGCFRGRARSRHRGARPQSGAMLATGRNHFNQDFGGPRSAVTWTRTEFKVGPGLWLRLLNLWRPTARI